MIFHDLEIKNFRIIEDPLKLKFPEEGKIGIFGLNEAGKSTLFESIEVALFGIRGQGTKKEDIVTWGKKTASIALEFSSGENKYLITRKIGATGGHRAELKQFVNGGWKPISSNVTEIGNQIEEITGLDRDSYSKLIYIRQKDLDALKDLSKSSREKMMNKVMGMDIFDDADKKAKEDRKELSHKLEVEQKRFEFLEHAKADFDEKTREFQEKNKKVESLLQEFAASETELSNKKIIFNALEWLKETSSKKEALRRIEETIKQLSERGNRETTVKKSINETQESISTKKRILSEYEDTYNRVDEAGRQFADMERKRGELKSDLNQFSKQLADIQVTHPKPQKKFSKTPYLIGAAVGLLLLLMGVVGALPTPYALVLSLIGFVILAIAIVIVLVKSGDQKGVAQVDINTESIKQNSQNTQVKLSEIKQQIASLAETSGIFSSKAAEEAKEKIIDVIKKETDAESISDLKSLTKADKKTIETLRKEMVELHESKISQQIGVNKKDITKIQKKLDELESEKPEKADELEYTDKEYMAAKREFEEASKSTNSIKGELKKLEGSIETLETDLKKLEKFLEEYPKVKAKIRAIDESMHIKERVIKELRETSKEIRSRIIPYAAYKIDQILPQITDGRYERLEITEDLQFKAYSLDAGESKPRNVFSGGTQDQFLIALRLAFTESILDSRVKADKYALMMDECTASSDEVRKQGIFDALEAMKTTFSQIFVISHEDISNQVDYSLFLDLGDNGRTKIRLKNW